MVDRDISTVSCSCWAKLRARSWLRRAASSDKIRLDAERAKWAVAVVAGRNDARAIAETVDLLSHPSIWVARSAVEALGRSGWPEATAAMVGLLDSKAAPGLAMSVVSALAETENQEFLEPVTRWVFEDAEPGAATRAGLKACVQLGASDALLEKALCRPGLYSDALEILRKRAGAEGRKRVHRTLLAVSTKPEVRTNLARWELSSEKGQWPDAAPGAFVRLAEPARSTFAYVAAPYDWFLVRLVGDRVWLVGEGKRVELYAEDGLNGTVFANERTADGPWVFGSGARRDLARWLRGARDPGLMPALRELAHDANPECADVALRALVPLKDAQAIALVVAGLPGQGTYSDRAAVLEELAESGWVPTTDDHRFCLLLGAKTPPPAETLFPGRCGAGLADAVVDWSKKHPAYSEAATKYVRAHFPGSTADIEVNVGLLRGRDPLDAARASIVLEGLHWKPETLNDRLDWLVARAYTLVLPAVQEEKRARFQTAQTSMRTLAFDYGVEGVERLTAIATHHGDVDLREMATEALATGIARWGAVLPTETLVKLAGVNDEIREFEHCDREGFSFGTQQEVVVYLGAVRDAANGELARRG